MTRKIAIESSDEPSGGSGHADWLRWMAVLPAAVLASVAVKYLSGIVFRLGEYGGTMSRDATGAFYYLQLLFLYVPKEAAFVIGGAKIAPRKRVATAVVLAVVGVLLSLFTHILGPTNVGATNHAHFACESAGLLVGVAAIYVWERKSRQIGNGLA